MFVPGKPFQPSLMFASKAESYPSGEPEKSYTWPYPQTLDWTGKTCQEEILGY
jgi:hypothetical protein